VRQNFRWHWGINAKLGTVLRRHGNALVSGPDRFPFSPQPRAGVTPIHDRDGGVARRMLPVSRGGTRGPLSQPRSLALGSNRVREVSALGVPLGRLGASFKYGPK
jgi:hypothetical protein